MTDEVKRVFEGYETVQEYVDRELAKQLRNALAGDTYEDDIRILFGTQTAMNVSRDSESFVETVAHLRDIGRMMEVRLARIRMSHFTMYEIKKGSKPPLKGDMISLFGVPIIIDNTVEFGKHVPEYETTK